ncbi:LysR family transcriptional regulator [Virgibacillus sp. LDC-1]|uniref:LysR family transcriptional regulator n=1 Tax=Virgibacillus sp. LDC-1 TaxID=3039856 RepID=UPI0024DE5375|nr:LysR family transcriptional regulator [Virgibacillus sp. LDC-1]
MDQHLLVFVTVVQNESFSKAAKELHMTQPAVSQYIRILEESLGARLLERTNKYVRLNKTGEIVFHHAKEIIGLYSKMQHLVEDVTNKPQGDITIGASYTFGEYVLPHILSVLQKKYPAIQPTVTIANTKTIAEHVESHQLDVGIVEGELTDKELIEEKLAEDYMVVVASQKHPLLEKEIVTSEALEKERWILREEGSGTRDASEKVFAQLEINPSKRIHFSSTQPIKEAVEAGLGVSLLSKWAIQKELRNGDLKVLEIEGLPLTRQFSIITNAVYQTKALEVFVDLLRKNDVLTI